MKPYKLVKDHPVFLYTVRRRSDDEALGFVDKDPFGDGWWAMTYPPTQTRELCDYRNEAAEQVWHLSILEGAQ